MAILRSLDGKFYEVPDDQLEKYEVPPEKVGEMGGPAPGEEPMDMDFGGGPGQITINMNFAGPPAMGGGPPPAEQGDVQGHKYYVNYYYNRYRAHYRNRY